MAIKTTRAPVLGDLDHDELPTSARRGAPRALAAAAVRDLLLATLRVEPGRDAGRQCAVVYLRAFGIVLRVRQGVLDSSYSVGYYHLITTFCNIVRSLWRANFQKSEVD